MAKVSTTQSWSSYLGFLLSVMGAAIGLGNIWKFPYMVGENGGGAFVMLYLVCVLMMGLPVMLAEMMLGRFGHNAVSAFKRLSREGVVSPLWQGLGWMGNITLLLVLSFYCVVAGFALAYFLQAVGGIFQGATPQSIQAHWVLVASNPYGVVGWTTVFLLITLAVVVRGVQAGLEKANAWMMPALFIILFILAIYGISQPGAYSACQFLFGFRLESLNAAVVVSAMGHAFFTLAIGAGCMLVYGSYVSRPQQIGSSVMTLAVMNIVVACMAGMAIYPLVFTFQLPLASGPSLMFEVLPVAFSQMTWGYGIGILFFLILLFAALTSAISFVEPLVVLLEERYALTRRVAVVYVGVVAWLLSLGSAFSFNLWKDWHWLGERTFFLMIADLATNILLPLGGLLFALVVGWGIARERLMGLQVLTHPGIFKIWYFLVKYVAPVGILTVLFYGLLSSQ